MMKSAKAMAYKSREKAKSIEKRQRKRWRKREDLRLWSYIMMWNKYAEENGVMPVAL